MLKRIIESPRLEIFIAIMIALASITHKAGLRRFRVGDPVYFKHMGCFGVNGMKYKSAYKRASLRHLLFAGDKSNVIIFYKLERSGQ